MGNVNMFIVMVYVNDFDLVKTVGPFDTEDNLWTWVDKNYLNDGIYSFDVCPLTDPN